LPISRLAARAIAGAVEVTPARHSRTLSAIAGTELYLKFENLQFTASVQGTRCAQPIAVAERAGAQTRVIAMSAGNHAQGVAYHAGRLGIPATIVMPEGTPFTKVKHTRDFGAHIVIGGLTLSECYTRAKALAVEHGYTLIHPYDDPLVIAGQGPRRSNSLPRRPRSTRSLSQLAEAA
jgi:threonine dehydratase